jgi:hypothetical protein
MAVSFISSTTSFLHNYGSLILPVAAELVTVVVFKRTTSSKVLFAGFVAGIGVSYFFDKKISLAIGLTGAVLYIIYKVVTTTSSSTQKQDLPASMKDVEDRWSELKTKLICISDKALDFDDPELCTQLTDLSKELRPQTKQFRAKWKDREFLIEAKEIMICCQKILFGVHASLEQKKLCLWSNSAQKMAELLKDPDHAREKQLFDSAFTLLNKSYRVARSQGYLISLPNIINYPDRNFSTLLTGGSVSTTYFERFFSRTGLHHEMNTIFNNTQDRLSNLLQHVYPGSPFNVKDEQLLPGDYGNNGNPFRIST